VTSSLKDSTSAPLAFRNGFRFARPGDQLGRSVNQVARSSAVTAGADVKDAQALMRHSKANTTLDIYQQFVPESQRRVVDRLTNLASMSFVN
jgi:integrase